MSKSELIELLQDALHTIECTDLWKLEITAQLERAIEEMKNVRETDSVIEKATRQAFAFRVLDKWITRGTKERFVIVEIRERQEAEKLNRQSDRSAARSNAEEAADIIRTNLGLDKMDILIARLASVSMKDFLGALSALRVN